MDQVALAKNARMHWLAQVFSADPVAISDEKANEHLFDRENDFGLDHFVQTARPLVKLRESRGDVTFSVGACDHAEPDRTYASLMLDDELVFQVVVRFEASLPCRIRYWMFYPPLPAGVEVRRYRADDAPGCAALERVCPMEMKNGDKWIVDRGERFNDYLKLMDDIDAAVVVAGDRVIGFYSCALRPISFNDQDTYCVYQHHYRVHPDYRAGSVSMALSSFVDARRTFETPGAQFPYSMIDPENAHMQNMGFPEAEGVQIARLSVPVSRLDKGGDCVTTGLDDIRRFLNRTHGTRTLFRETTNEMIKERCNRISSYNLDSFRSNPDAVIGIWQANERNVLDRDGRHEEMRLSFALDYGYNTLEGFENLLHAVAPALSANGTTHLCFLMDTRAEEYAVIDKLAEDAQLLKIHTLPWITESFSARTVYCDAVYC